MLQLSVLLAARLVVTEMFRDPATAAAKAAAEAGAEGMATPEVSMTCTVVIPSQACGLIIGKGGERINLLRETTQSKIQVQSKDKAVPGVNERTVSVQGNMLQCQMGVEQVARIMFEDGTVQYENQSTNYGMAGMQAGVGLGAAGLGGLGAAGLYGGMMGGNLDFQSLAGFPGQHGMGAGMGAGIGGGLGGDFGGGAGQITMKLAIAETSVGILVGKAGCVIKELMQISGANIKVSQKGEVVPGTTNRYECMCALCRVGLW